MRSLRFFLPTLASALVLGACSGGSGSSPISNISVPVSGALQQNAGLQQVGAAFQTFPERANNARRIKKFYVTNSLTMT